MAIVAGSRVVFKIDHRRATVVQLDDHGCFATRDACSLYGHVEDAAPIPFFEGEVEELQTYLVQRFLGGDTYEARSALCEWMEWVNSKFVS